MQYSVAISFLCTAFTFHSSTHNISDLPQGPWRWQSLQEAWKRLDGIRAVAKYDTCRHSWHLDAWTSETVVIQQICGGARQAAIPNVTDRPCVENETQCTWRPRRSTERRGPATSMLKIQILWKHVKTAVSCARKSTLDLPLDIPAQPLQALYGLMVTSKLASCQHSRSASVSLKNIQIEKRERNRERHKPSASHGKCGHHVPSPATPSSSQPAASPLKTAKYPACLENPKPWRICVFTVEIYL